MSALSGETLHPLVRSTTSRLVPPSLATLRPRIARAWYRFVSLEWASIWRVSHFRLAFLYKPHLMCCYRACFFQSLEPKSFGPGSQQVFLSSLAMWANPSLASYPLLFPYADGAVCLLVPAPRRPWQLRVIWLSQKATVEPVGWSGCPLRCFD